MALPSLEGNWFSGKRGNARLYLLDVRDKRHPEGAPIAQLLVEREETMELSSVMMTVSASAALAASKRSPGPAAAAPPYVLRNLAIV